MEILVSWDEYSLVKVGNELEVICLLDSLPKIEVSNKNGEVVFRRVVDLVVSHSSYDFREKVADAKLADEAIRMFEIYLEDIQDEPVVEFGEYLDVLKDQELYDHLVRDGNYSVEFAEFALNQIGNWNFFEESFDEFSENLYLEFKNNLERDNQISVKTIK